MCTYISISNTWLREDNGIMLSMWEDMIRRLYFHVRISEFAFQYCNCITCPVCIGIVNMIIIKRAYVYFNISFYVCNGNVRLAHIYILAINSYIFAVLNNQHGYCQNCTSFYVFNAFIIFQNASQPRKKFSFIPDNLTSDVRYD